MTISALTGSSPSVAEVFAILLLNSQSRKSTILMWEGGKNTSQDAVWNSGTLWHSISGKRTLEICIYHWYPLTISNRGFYNFPVVFFLEALQIFIFSINFYFVSTWRSSRISKSLNSHRVKFGGGGRRREGRIILSFVIYLGQNHRTGLSQSILNFNLHYWFLEWPSFRYFKALNCELSQSNCEFQKQEAESYCWCTF